MLVLIIGGDDSKNVFSISARLIEEFEDGCIRIIRVRKDSKAVG